MILNHEHTCKLYLVNLNTVSVLVQYFEVIFEPRAGRNKCGIIFLTTVAVFSHKKITFYTHQGS